MLHWNSGKLFDDSRASVELAHRELIAAGRGAAVPAMAAVIAENDLVVWQSGSIAYAGCMLRETGRHALDLLTTERPGSGVVVVNNDPFAGGISLAHIVIQAPIVQAGKAVGVFGVGVQHADIGEMRAGARSTMREITHEGMRISNLLLASSKDGLEEWFEHIFAANIRERESGVMILREQVKAARRGAANLSALLASDAISARDDFAKPGAKALAGIHKAETKFNLKVDDEEQELVLTLAEAPTGVRISVTGDLRPSLNGRNSPWSMSLAACEDAVAQRLKFPGWQAADLVELIVARDSVLHPVYPYGVRHGLDIAHQLNAAVARCLAT